MGRVAAVFDNVAQADGAVSELRSKGLKDDHLSLVTRHDENEIKKEAGQDLKETTADVGGGALAGAGVGSVVGVTLALIPGMLPFAAAGTIMTAMGSAVISGGAAGAATGGAIGALTGALAKADFEREEARHYAEAIDRGGVLIVVDSDNLDDDTVHQALTSHGGKTYHAHGSDALKPATE